MEKQIEEILSGGYKSPIEIIMGQAIAEFEDGIYKAIQGYCVNVDKEEMIRALLYDRGQYEKGYADGLRHRETEWIRVEERLPELNDWVLLYTDFGKHIVGWRVKDGWWHTHTCMCKPDAVTHWMPLPLPPKGK